MTPAPASVAPAGSPDAAPSTGAAATPGASLATTGRIEVADKGFALTLPDGWTRVDVTARATSRPPMAASDLDPALAEQYAAQIKAMLGTGLSIFAFGPDPTAGTQVTVLALPSMGLSLDLLDQINTAQLEPWPRATSRPSGSRSRPARPSTTATRSARRAAAGATLDQYFIIAGAEPARRHRDERQPRRTPQAIANSVEILD